MCFAGQFQFKRAVGGVQSGEWQKNRVMPRHGSIVPQHVTTSLKNSKTTCCGMSSLCCSMLNLLNFRVFVPWHGPQNLKNKNTISCFHLTSSNLSHPNHPHSFSIAKINLFPINPPPKYLHNNQFSLIVFGFCKITIVFVFFFTGVDYGIPSGFFKSISQSLVRYIYSWDMMFTS